MPLTEDYRRIQIYNQGRYPHIGYARDGGSLADNGCGAFTLNHAMQWIGMSHVPSPESMAQTDMERGLLGFDPGYFVKSAQTYGFLAEDMYLCCNDREQFMSRIDRLFRQGSAVTLHVRGDNGFTGRRTSGHYCADVGITADKSKVHIIDSSSGTTLGVLKSTEYNGYYYSDGSFSTGGVGCIPTYCWQPTRGDVRVLPSARYLTEGPAGMSGEAHERLVQSYWEITGVLSDACPVLEE